MSVCVPAEEDGGSEEANGPMREPYEQKAASKVVRVLTVLAYLLSVSLAAILLSVYYICVWKSPDLPPLNDTDPADSGEPAAPSARQAVVPAIDYYQHQHPSILYLDGRSNTTVNMTEQDNNMSEYMSGMLSGKLNVQSESSESSESSELAATTTTSFYNNTNDTHGNNTLTT